MEFRFNIEHYFTTKIVKVKSSLIPEGFHGDRRMLLDTTSKFSEIINDMGEASARAQGLTRPVTTAQKLRNSNDHTVYLMYEKGGKNGLVTGLLKIGKKLLYVFDSEGETHTVDAYCVLDFFIHESRQRFGLGKELFQFMLESENLKANQLAIDRPSDKLLAFLLKHYDLKQQIPQMNNFVIYEGFFELNDDSNNNTISNGHSNLHITDSPNMNLFGPQFKTTPVANRTNTLNSSHKHHLAATPTFENLQATHIGRYAAPRPLGSMAEIIHNSPVAVTREADRSRFLAPGNQYDRSGQMFLSPTTHEMALLNGVGDYQPSLYTEMEDDLQSSIAPSSMDAMPVMKYGQQTPNVETIEEEEPVQEEEPTQEGQSRENDEVDYENKVEVNEIEPIKLLQSPNQSFHYSKQHTGLKNLSFNVGAAVMPSSEMEFDQKKLDSFGVVKITRPLGKEAAPAQLDGHTIIGRKKSLRLDIPIPDRLTPNYRNNNLTEQGFLDLKFYHNKLW